MVRITLIELHLKFMLALYTCCQQLPLKKTVANVHVTSYRLKSAKLTDKRINIMNEVITGIRVIKMYAWEYAFKKVVSAIRRYKIQ